MHFLSFLNISQTNLWTGLHCEEYHGAALLCVLVSQQQDDQLWGWGCRGAGSNQHQTSFKKSSLREVFMQEQCMTLKK